LNLSISHDKLTAYVRLRLRFYYFNYFTAGIFYILCLQQRRSQPWF